jgi:cytochrome c-type biogenesis protein CcmH/NrfF
LWSAPILLLIGTAIYLVRRTRSRASGDVAPQPDPLSPAEQKQLAALLGRDDQPR